MFAIVESGSIKEMMNGNTGITIGDVQYILTFSLNGLKVN